MIKHTYHVLEFHRLLHILSGYASCPLGRSDCLSRKPSRDLTEIDNEHRLVSEMKLLLKLKGFSPLEGLIDIKHFIKQSKAEGSSLEPEKLLSILQIAQAASRAKKSILSQRDICPGLCDLIKEIVLCNELIESINKSIYPDGTIKDSASQKLKKIRRWKTEIRRTLQKRLEDIKATIGLDSRDDDPLISIRDGRYVIPVRTEMKNRIQGIIHDYSRTRATCFLEPLEAVHDNNRLAELRHLEREEELKVLTLLTEIVRAAADDLLDAQSLLGRLDGLYARARLSNALKGVRPVMDMEGKVELKGAINPLLMFAAPDGEPPVPVDIFLDSDVNVMIISGPNRGGKTVTLKTIGLLSLMAQAGLHIPAEEGSRLPVFKNILAEIGDEQDIQAGLSTFSAHISNLKYMVDHADHESLILIDEPGMGTDPDEGAALGMALLDDLAQKGALVVVSTHYNRLKSYGLLEKRVKNACMEFDESSNRPTFSLRYGTPGTSYAFELAKEQGIGPDILSRARTYLDQDEVRLNRLIDKLNHLKCETEVARSEAEHIRNKYRSAREKLLRTIKKLESDRKEMLESKRNEAELLIKEAREELKKLISTFKEKKGASQAFVQQKYHEMTGRLNKELYLSEEKGRPADIELFKPGQIVRHRGLNLEGRILSLDPAGSKAQIITGNLKFSADINDLMGVSDKTGQGLDESSGDISYRYSGNLTREINLIGYRVEDAIPLIDKIIDRSMVEGDLSLRIVHGHGTGRLKSAIRNHLKDLSCVKRIAGEDPRYGGEAITIVELN